MSRWRRHYKLVRNATVNGQDHSKGTILNLDPDVGEDLIEQRVAIRYGHTGLDGWDIENGFYDGPTRSRMRWSSRTTP